MVIVVSELRTGLTVISIVIVAAQVPFARGVNVYVIVPTLSVLIVAGLHVPWIPLSDTRGSCGGVEFWHKGSICSNIGSVCVVINTSIVVTVPHWFAVGVNV